MYIEHASVIKDMVTKRENEILNDLYFNLNSPISFTSLSNLYNATRGDKISKKTIQEWLSKQASYTLHKSMIKRFPRRKMHATKPNAIWQCDLADMSFIQTSNNHNTFLLCCIDVFSRMAYVEPIKDKTGLSVKAAFTKIFTKNKIIPQCICTDLGREFYNKNVQALFKQKNIRHFSTHSSEIKAALCERFIRTLRSRLYKYLTANVTHRYVDVLQKIVNNYNNTKHSSIGMAPSNVKNASIERVWHYSWNRRNIPDRQPKLKSGQIVRISKYKSIHSKEALPNWSDEIFIIHSIQSERPPSYILKDMKDRILEGIFYEYELQVVQKPDIYRIEKVLRKRKNKLLIRWSGYGPEFDSWIDKRWLNKKI